MIQNCWGISRRWWHRADPVSAIETVAVWWRKRTLLIDKARSACPIGCCRGAKQGRSWSIREVRTDCAVFSGRFSLRGIV